MRQIPRTLNWPNRLLPALIGCTAAIAACSADKSIEPESLGKASAALTNCSGVAQWTVTTYSGGNRVTNLGGLYECKPWPFSGWCGQAGYEPGVTLYWQDAWVKIDDCSGTSTGTGGAGGAGGADGGTGGAGGGGDPCDLDSQRCCPPGQLRQSGTAASDVVQLAGPQRCYSAGAGDDVVTAPQGPVSLLGGPGSDNFMGSSAADLIRGGSGDDTINAGAGADNVYGDDGNDTIDSGDGDDTVDPGPGVDNVNAGAGADTVVVHDLCEVSSGETLDGGDGNDTLVSPVPLAELQARGVNVVHFENVIVRRDSCRSECATRPDCSPHGGCTEGSVTGQMACICDHGWTGSRCETEILEACPIDEDCVCRPPCQCDKKGGVWVNGKCIFPVPSSAIVWPNYRLITAFSLPPGNNSSVSADSTTTSSTRTETKTSWKATASATAEGKVLGNGVEVEFKVWHGQSSGDSEETRLAQGSGITYSSRTDPIDHNGDAFVIWFNPEVLLSDDGLGNVTSTTRTRGGQPASVFMFTIGQLLKFDTSITDSAKQMALASLTPYDIQQIVKQSPWGDAYFKSYTWGDVNIFSPALDPKRFEELGMVLVEGPSPGSGIINKTYTQSYSEFHGTIKGNETGGSAEVRGVGGVNVALIQGDVKFGAGFEYAYENTTETGTDLQKTATYSLGSTTECWHQNVHVFYDAMFGTYVFVPADEGSADCTQPAAASGRLVDGAGNPVVGQMVSLTLAGGKTLRVGTDANGVYRAYNVDPAQIMGVAPPSPTQSLVEAGQFTFR